MFRPKDWRRPKSVVEVGALGADTGECRAYEAGADEMLGVVNDYLVPYGINFGDDGVFHATGREYKRIKKNLYLVIPEEVGNV